MEREQAKAMAQRFVDALHKLEKGSEADVDEIVSLFAGNARLTNAALKGRELSGQDGTREFWTEYRKTFGEAYSEFSHVLADEQAAGLFWTTKGTGNDGQPLAYDGVSLLEWSEDGKIGFFRGYYDTRQLNQGLGIDEAPARARGES